MEIESDNLIFVEAFGNGNIHCKWVELILFFKYMADKEINTDDWMNLTKNLMRNC